jgi:hypothetical protein
MKPEIWAALAALLLVTASVAWGLVLFKVGGRWDLIAIGTRAVAALALVVALILTVATLGRWSPFDLQQVALALALATLVVSLGLVWRFRIDVAAPIVDLVALLLILTGRLAGQFAGAQLACVQDALSFRIQWVLFLLGSGALAVAGSAGLMLALRAGLIERAAHLRWPRWADLHALVKQATALALVALGGGLTVNIWSAWRTAGTLTGGDSRVGWIAIAWLIATMSLLPRRTGKRWGRWTASLVVVAAAVAIVSLLAVMDLRGYLGL